MLPRITFARMPVDSRETAGTRSSAAAGAAQRSRRMSAMNPEPTGERPGRVRNRRPPERAEWAQVDPGRRWTPSGTPRSPRRRLETRACGTRVGRSAWVEGPGTSGRSPIQAGRDEDAQHAEPVPPGSHGKRHACDALHAEGDAIHRAAVVAVGDVPRDQREKDDGQELHEARHPQHEGAVGQLVDLPAHRHGEDLERDPGGDAGAPEPPRRPDARGGAPRLPRASRSSQSGGVILDATWAASLGNRRT